jgi:lysophospholipase L1-like esterase
MVAQDCSVLRLNGFSWITGNSGESNNPNNINVVEVALEDNTSASTPVTFGGSRTTTILPTDIEVLSDVVFPSAFGLSKFSVGEIYWVKGTISIPVAGHQIPFTPRNTGHYAGQQVRWYDPAVTFGSDVDTYGQFTYTGTAPDSRGQGFQFFVLGQPIVDQKSVFATGDSIGEGVGDGQAASTLAGIHGHGSIQRAMRVTETTGLIPSMNFCRSGNDANDTGTRQRTFIKYATVVLDQYGANDIGQTGSWSASQQTDLENKFLTHWTNMRNAGANIILRPHVIPRTNSTDNWATLVNQIWDAGISSAKWGSGGASTQFNDWITARVADNTVNATNTMPSIRDAVETLKWPVDGTANYSNTDGTHPSTVGHTLMANDLRTLINSV